VTVEIRPLRPDDVPAAHTSSFETFVELDRRLGDPYPEHTDDVRRRGEARVAHLQRTDPHGAWVAEADGRVAGVALALRRGPLWFLSLLTVEPGLQGQGVGGRLLQAALGTSEDADAGWILASADPRALRRYAGAGFALHPGYDAHGPVDRAALPAGLGVREGDLASHADLVEDVVTRLRGTGYGPEHEVFAAVGASVLVAEDGADRGYCLHASGRLMAVGATSEELARRLLWAGLAHVQGEAQLGFMTSAQQWAVDIAVAARLTVKPGSSSCQRGALGPLTPYLPTGAYG
jgi:predicted N-acetyltransferase YhbS